MPDAAVVGHHVEAFVAVRGGGDGADFFARRVFAVHAEHGLVDDRLGQTSGCLGACEASCAGVAPARYPSPDPCPGSSDRRGSSAFRGPEGPAPCRRWGYCSRPGRRSRRPRSRCRPSDRRPCPSGGRSWAGTTGCRSHRRVRPAVEAVLVEDRQRVGLLDGPATGLFDTRPAFPRGSTRGSALHGLFADRVDDVMVLHGGQRIGLTGRPALTAARPPHALSYRST